MTPLTALVAQRSEIDAQINQLKAAHGAEVRRQCDLAGLTVTDVFPEVRAPQAAPVARPAAREKPGTRAKVAPKYRHPTTGATWTGRGFLPVWLREAEAAGQPRAAFLIPTA